MNSDSKKSPRETELYQELVRLWKNLQQQTNDQRIGMVRRKGKNDAISRPDNIKLEENVQIGQHVAVG